MFSIERGENIFHLHFQGVICLRVSNTIGVKRRITRVLRWDEPGRRLLGVEVCLKILMNKGVHSCVGMLVYYHKDEKEPNFEKRTKNISEEMVDHVWIPARKKYIEIDQQHHASRSSVQLLQI